MYSIVSLVLKYNFIHHGRGEIEGEAFRASPMRAFNCQVWAPPTDRSYKEVHPSLTGMCGRVSFQSVPSLRTHTLALSGRDPRTCQPIIPHITPVPKTPHHDSITITGQEHNALDRSMELPVLPYYQRRIAIA